MAARILIVDDEETIRFSLRGIFEDEGHEVLETASAEEGLALLESESPDIMVLDIWLPGMDGLTALGIAHTSYPDIPVIMISGHGTIETAVTAIQQGAYDFIEKPLSLEKVLITTARAIEAVALRRENNNLRKALSKNRELVGQSVAMIEFRTMLSRVAPTGAWVLLTGENGTGKELAARALHAESTRRGNAFIAVNCAAIPEELIESELFGHEKGSFTGAENSHRGRFEIADKGTLFLDEIGDMSLKAQAKVLRILQEQSFEKIGGTRTIKVDVRVIAATNKNLEKAIKEGTFRQDLYYRLRVVPLHLPPLRERGLIDIELLLNMFIGQLCIHYGCEPPLFLQETLDVLGKYSWPGNVRELRNFAERMVILYAGRNIGLRELPSEIYTSASKSNDDLEYSTSREYIKISLEADFKQAKADFEAKFLAEKLQECGGNITRLAESIGLERSYVYRKLKGYKIHSVE